MIFNLFKYLKQHKIDFTLTNGYMNIIYKKGTQVDINIIFLKNALTYFNNITRKFI